MVALHWKDCFVGLVFCFKCKQELAFRGHDESEDSLSKGNYRQLLECFAKFDSVFER